MLQTVPNCVEIQWQFVRKTSIIVLEHAIEKSENSIRIKEHLRAQSLPTKRLLNYS